MKTITPKQVLDLRLKLNMSQEAFADHLSVSRASVGTWELGKSKPRGENRDNLIDLYEHTVGKPPTAKAKKTNGGGSHGNGEHTSKGGRHKVSMTRVTETALEIEDYILGMTTEARVRKIAEKYELDFSTLREAIVVFCYGMDEMPAKNIAQHLSGHE